MPPRIQNPRNCKSQAILGPGNQIVNLVTKNMQKFMKACLSQQNEQDYCINITDKIEMKLDIRKLLVTWKNNNFKKITTLREFVSACNNYDIEINLDWDRDLDKEEVLNHNIPFFSIMQQKFIADLQNLSFDVLKQIIASMSTQCLGHIED